MPVDLNLPIPGQSPNWGQQLNDEIEKLNQSMNQGVFLTSDYGVVGDGVTDDTQAMQNLIDSVPDGSTIVSPPESTILTSGWVVDQKNISFDLSNSHILTKTTAPILNARGGWGPTISVSSLSGGTLTVTDTSGFAVGDIVKVFSNTVIWDARPGDGDLRARLGEFAVVRAITSATEMSVSPSLMDSYGETSNIRVAKLLPYTVKFEFGTAEPAPGTPSQGDQAMFRFRSLIQPTLKGKCRRNNAAFSGFTSCFMPVADVDVANLPGGNGYGVASSAGVGGFFTIRANRLRHAYTDDCQRILPNDPDPGSYGRPMYDTITGKSYATSSSSWDTHHGGYGHKFVDIIAVGTTGSGEPGFSLRGRNHEWNNCTAVACALGFRVFDESNTTAQDSWAVSEGHRMVGCSTRRCYQGITVSMASYTQADRGPNVVIEGGVFEVTGGYPIYLRRARVYMNEPTILYTGASAPTAGSFINCGLVEIRGSVRIDGRAINAGQVLLIDFSDAGTSRQAVDLDIDAALSQFALDNATALIRYRTAAGMIRVVLNATTVAPLISQPMLNPVNQSATLRTRNSNSLEASSAQVALSNPNGATLGTGRSADQVIEMTLGAQTNMTTGAVQGGAFAGQMLVIMNRADTAGTITIPHGSSFNTDLGGSNVALPPGYSMTLLWDGRVTPGTWRRVRHV